MPAKPDDLEAVRTIISALQSFEAAEQERIIRWVREKLGLGTGIGQGSSESTSPVSPTTVAPRTLPTGQTDLRGFVGQKRPASDIHFAATVAYYYRFEAPESERKDAIGPNDLLDACRIAGRGRMQNPGQTLRNAHRDGLLDRADRGTFRINTVGENLVAMALPSKDVVNHAETVRHSGRGRKKKASRRE
jgi:hypothetical protein